MHRCYDPLLAYQGPLTGGIGQASLSSGVGSAVLQVYNVHDEEHNTKLDGCMQSLCAASVAMDASALPFCCAPEMHLQLLFSSLETSSQRTNASHALLTYHRTLAQRNDARGSLAQGENRALALQHHFS